MNRTQEEVEDLVPGADLHVEEVDPEATLQGRDLLHPEEEEASLYPVPQGSVLLLLRDALLLQRGALLLQRGQCLILRQMDTRAHNIKEALNQ